MSSTIIQNHLLYLILDGVNMKQNYFKLFWNNMLNFDINKAKKIEESAIQQGDQNDIETSDELPFR